MNKIKVTVTVLMLFVSAVNINADTNSNINDMNASIDTNEIKEGSNPIADESEDFLVTLENEPKPISKDDLSDNASANLFKSIVSSGVSGNAEWLVYDDNTAVIKAIPGTNGQMRDPIKATELSNFEGRLTVEEGVLLPNTSDLFRNAGLKELILKNDTANLMYGDHMFSGMKNLEFLDISKMNTENFSTMGYMFADLPKLKNLDVSSFNTKKVYNFANMFNGASALESLDISNFNTSSLVWINNMFKNMPMLTTLELGNMDTSKVTQMVGVFWGAKKLERLDVSSFNTENVTSMTGMFNGLEKIESLDLSNFDTRNVTIMGNMFYSFKTEGLLDISTFNTNSQTHITGLLAFSDIQRIKLGGDFETLEGSKLPGIVGDQYTGRWVQEEDSTQIFESSSDFVAGYSGGNSSLVGTYTKELKTYKVNFVNPLDSTLSKTYSVKYNLLVDSVPAVSLDGFDFIEWNTEMDGTGKTFDPSVDVIVDDLTVYAIYVRNDFTVTYQLNGGTGGPTDTNKYAIGDTVTVVFTPEPVKAGYEFIGWEYNGVKYLKNASQTSSHKIVVDGEDMVFTAIWDEISENETDNDNDGSDDNNNDGSEEHDNGGSGDNGNNDSVDNGNGSGNVNGNGNDKLPSTGVQATYTVYTGVAVICLGLAIMLVKRKQRQ